MKKTDLLLLIFCIIISQLVGALGSFFNFYSLDSWYRQLEKSILNPPDWVFGPVWIIIFTLLGISLYLVISEVSKKNAKQKKYFRFGMIAFIVQWLLNIVWSFVFFYLRDPLLALVEIIFLAISITVAGFYFYRLRPAAAYLLVPYLAWVLFAAYLNFAIWQLN